MKISGFITNLGKYNEGELVGEWIDFPISDEELQAVLQRIGIGSTDQFGSPYEEVFFTDWELPEGMDWQVFGEYPDISQVNEVAEVIENSDYDEEVISAIFEQYSTLQEALDVLENGDFMVMHDVTDAESLGEYYVNEVDGGISNLDRDTLESYFDYESYGRNLEISGNVVYYSGGAIEFFK